VKSNIFINADLTPAEAKAAYEMRCRRREAQKCKTVLEFRRSKSLSQSHLNLLCDIQSSGTLSAGIGSQSTSRLNTTTVISENKSASAAVPIAENNINPNINYFEVRTVNLS